MVEIKLDFLSIRIFKILLCGLMVSCANPLGDSKVNGNPTMRRSTFNSWTKIIAVGRSTPAAQASDISATSAYVTFSWAPMTVGEGTIESYRVFRAESSGAQNYFSPLASGISASNPTFTDTSVADGSTYYYVVAPVVSGAVAPPNAGAGTELKIPVPPSNMALVHRWMANKEMCEEMGKTPIPSENYRCQVSAGASAPPGTGGSGYFDLSRSLFYDTFEQGCNYTATNSCTDASVNGGAASPCIGIQNSPNGTVTAAVDSIYYSRRSGSCFVNTNGANAWTAIGSASSSQQVASGSNRPGLPPLVNINQSVASTICNGQSVTGIGAKRLPKRQEFIAASAWNPDLTDSAINTVENGINLHSTGNCNSNSASPQGAGTTDVSGTAPILAFSNSVIPTGKDSLPACLHGDCSSSASTIRSLRTGSLSTTSCVSRFGIRDLVGNVSEWSSDQISCDGTNCTGIAAAGNSIDSTNDDFSGVSFDGNQGPNTGGTFTSFGRIQLPIAIPIVSGGFTGDGVVSKTSAQFRGDYFYISVTNATRGVLNGANWDRAAAAGRYGTSFSTGTTSSASTIGFRCVSPAE